MGHRGKMMDEAGQICDEDGSFPRPQPEVNHRQVSWEDGALER